MIQFAKRNAVKIWLTLLTIVAVGMGTIIGVAIAQSTPSERPKVEHSDTKMPEPGPGIGLNGKFNPNFLGTAPGL
jgi:hypothetical protein